MKPGGSIIALVLWIVSTAAAQATQPATFPSVELFPGERPRPIRTFLAEFPKIALPDEPRGQRVDPQIIFRRTIEARDAIKTIRYRVDYDRDIDEKHLNVRVADRGFVQHFAGTLDCYLIDVTGTSRHLDTGEPVSPVPGTRFFVNRDYLVSWAVGTINPQQKWFASEEHRASFIAEARGNSWLHLLKYWGFGFRMTGDPSEVAALDFNDWFDVGTQGPVRVYETWNMQGARPRIVATTHLHERSGLIVFHQQYNVLGEISSEESCEVEQFPDAIELHRMHWVPIRISARAIKYGHPYLAFRGAVSDVRINEPFDCDAASRVIRDELPRNPRIKLFERGPDGKARAYGLRDGAWVDLQQTEVPAGAVIADVDELEELSHEVPGKGNVDRDSLSRSVTILIFVAALAMTVCGVLVYRSSMLTRRI